ncbi:serine hydrolase domain-containing protein [Amycolatopsis samaneae]|uniref:Serine hydrolase domain-containing protein n=1 Tax=Amycolatopsis samaneae TaxID=664691 RepID=A0ABW5GRT4_9PSEU
MDVAWLSRTFLDLAEEHRVPGAQLAVHHSGVTTTVEHGEELYGSGRPVGTKSSFPFGSVTKPFTATLVAQLAGEGELDLDAPIGVHLPELAGMRATPRHLLGHTGGLVAEHRPAGAAPSPRSYVARCRDLVPLSPPGLRFSYSNVGYYLLGRLIEVVTGQDWPDAVTGLLLAPLGITPVFRCFPPGPTVGGHVVRAGRVQPVPGEFPVFRAPAGGLAGSAADLVRFGRVLLGEGPSFVLDAAGARLMRGEPTGAAPFGLADGWGLGLARFRHAGTDWFGHDGGSDGTTAHLRFDPANGIAVAVTTNSADGTRLWEDLAAEARIGSYGTSAPPGPPVPGPPGCAGEYRNGDNHYSVRPGGAGFRLDMGTATALDMTFHEGLVFDAGRTAAGRPVYVGRFGRDSDGAIAVLEVAGRVARRIPDGEDPR